MKTFLFQVLNIIKNSNLSTSPTITLHRWGNHKNNDCLQRIDKCMSLKWNDYTSHSFKDIKYEKEINKYKT